MGKAMEVIDTFRTVAGADSAPGATTPYTGDTLSIRNFDSPAKAWLADMWAVGATAGIARVRSPRLHDNVQGIRFRYAAGLAARGMFTEYDRQMLYAQDALIAEAQVGAAETDGLSLLVYYEDLPGVDARLATIEEITPRIVNLVNDEVQLASGVAVGSREASVAFNSGFDLMIANTDYAILGYEVDVTGQSIGFRGPDTGNLRVGGPQTTERMETRDWFVRQNKRLGVPTIPIINSANKAGTFVDGCQIVTSVTTNVTLVMAELSS